MIQMAMRLCQTRGRQPSRGSHHPICSSTSSRRRSRIDRTTLTPSTGRSARLDLASVRAATHVLPASHGSSVGYYAHPDGAGFEELRRSEDVKVARLMQSVRRTTELLHVGGDGAASLPPLSCVPKEMPSVGAIMESATGTTIRELFTTARSYQTLHEDLIDRAAKSRPGENLVRGYAYDPLRLALCELLGQLYVEATSGKYVVLGDSALQRRGTQALEETSPFAVAQPDFSLGIAPNIDDGAAGDSSDERLFLSLLSEDKPPDTSMIGERYMDLKKSLAVLYSNFQLLARCAADLESVKKLRIPLLLFSGRNCFVYLFGCAFGGMPGTFVLSSLKRSDLQDDVHDSTVAFDVFKDAQLLFSLILTTVRNALDAFAAMRFAPQPRSPHVTVMISITQPALSRGFEKARPRLGQLRPRLSYNGREWSLHRQITDTVCVYSDSDGPKIVAKMIEGNEVAVNFLINQNCALCSRLMHGEIVTSTGDPPFSVLIMPELAPIVISKFDVNDLFQLAADVMEALDALHSSGYCHLDVKASNILRHGGNRFVLADFGHAVFLSTMNLAANGLGGTPSKCPQEQRDSGLAVDKATDYFAFGRTLLELLYRKRFSAENSEGVLMAPPLTSIKTEVGFLRFRAPGKEEQMAAFAESIRTLSAGFLENTKAARIAAYGTLKRVVLRQLRGFDVSGVSGSVGLARDDGSGSGDDGDGGSRSGGDGGDGGSERGGGGAGAAVGPAAGGGPATPPTTSGLDGVQSLQLRPAADILFRTADGGEEHGHLHVLRPRSAFVRLVTAASPMGALVVELEAMTHAELRALLKWWYCDELDFCGAPMASLAVLEFLATYECETTRLSARRAVRRSAAGLAREAAVQMALEVGWRLASLVSDDRDCVCEVLAGAGLTRSVVAAATSHSAVLWRAIRGGGGTCAGLPGASSVVSCASEALRHEPALPLASHGVASASEKEFVWM